MPVWLEVVLNLVGYAGFLALAARSTSRSDSSNDDHASGDKPCQPSPARSRAAARRGARVTLRGRVRVFE
jgi:hypothetical protein